MVVVVVVIFGRFIDPQSLTRWLVSRASETSSPGVFRRGPAFGIDGVWIDPHVEEPIPIQSSMPQKRAMNQPDASGPAMSTPKNIHII